MKRMLISSRKKQHVNITVTKDVSFKSKTSGFERWDFQHNALPEINYSEITTDAQFLGRTIKLPMIISSMTGGYQEAITINRRLAEICAQKGLALGVGSQRQALESTFFHRSFSVVREVSKDIPVFGNVGATEIANIKDVAPFQRLVELIAADGFAIHLNPLQEFLQPEGNTNFRGVLAGIELLVKTLSVPILVKEIGAGISSEVAKKLIDVGVLYLDVAGAGGTSWAGVEILRGKNVHIPHRNGLKDIFWDWGIPTSIALQEASKLKMQYPQVKLIASGGISNGVEGAKSLALGADFYGVARPIIRALSIGGVKSVIRHIDQWETELRGVMFLTGSQNITELQKRKLIVHS